MKIRSLNFIFKSLGIVLRGLLGEWFRRDPILKYRYPLVDKELCVGCTACSTVCPASAIDFKDEVSKKTRTVVWSYDRCHSCGACAERCPENPGCLEMVAGASLRSNRKESLKLRLVFEVLVCESCGKVITTRRQVLSLLSKVRPEILMSNPFIYRTWAEGIRPLPAVTRRKSGLSRSDYFSKLCPVCREKVKRV